MGVHKPAVRKALRVPLNSLQRKSKSQRDFSAGLIFDGGSDLNSVQAEIFKRPFEKAARRSRHDSLLLEPSVNPVADLRLSVVPIHVVETAESREDVVLKR